MSNEKKRVSILIEASAMSTGNPRDFRITDEIQEMIFDHVELTNAFTIDGEGVWAECSDGRILIKKN